MKKNVSNQRLIQEKFSLPHTSNEPNNLRFGKLVFEKSQKDSGNGLSEGCRQGGKAKRDQQSMQEHYRVGGFSMNAPFLKIDRKIFEQNEI